MYRGLLARIGKSKVIEGSKNSSDDQGSECESSNSSAEKPGGAFEDGKPLFKGKIVSRPSIDFGAYDPQWIDRAASAPSSTKACEEAREQKDTEPPKASPDKVVKYEKDAKEKEEEQLNEAGSSESTKDDATHDAVYSNDDAVYSNDDAVSSNDDAVSSNDDAVSRPPKRPLDKPETPEGNGKQAKMDVRVPPPFFRPPIPHGEPYWRRGGGPFRGRGRGPPPPWGRPFPPRHPFPPFFNGHARPPPPHLHPRPPPVPPLNKVIKQRFSVPPPCVTKKDPPPPNKAPGKPSAELVQDSETPLWSTPYEKQLKIKEDRVLAFMNRLKTETLNANRALHAWYSHQESNFPSICKLLPMVPGPLCVGYQSRCDFTIGLDKDNPDKPAVGVPLVDGDSHFVGAIDKLKNIPKRIKYATKSLEAHLMCSSYKAFDPVSKEGNWLGVSVRMTATDELMMVVSFDPQGCEKLQIKQVRLKLKEYFENGEGSLSEVSSLYFQEKTPEGGPFELLLGAEAVSEKVCEHFFRITPRIPFCRNTSGMETVFRVMADSCGLDGETTLVDLCCGGGTVGLALSQHVGQVLGLDIVEEFVNDARNNSAHNGVTNCEFFSGSGENYLPVLLNRANFSNIVLVVDPPEIPFDSKVIANIRKAPNISRVVWLVSDPLSGLKSFEDLVRPPSNQYKGDPFVPVSLIPVDTFPHTFQFTMVLILMRVSMRELVSPREVNVQRFYGGGAKPTPSPSASSSSVPSFSECPPPDLSWKKVEDDKDHSGLSKEQLSWLNQMSTLYKKDFDRHSWVESLKVQNKEAVGGRTVKLPPPTSHPPPKPPPPAASFPYPPPSQQGYTVPPIINSTPGSIPKATAGPTPEYWAQYSKQYSSYMMSYGQNAAAPPATAAYQQQQPRTPAGTGAWKVYCEQMANYWGQWAAHHQKPPPAAPLLSGRPPPPPSTTTTNPPPPLPPNNKLYKGPK